MDDKWKEALRKMRVKIIQNLANPDCVADCLYADGVFNDEMKGEIEVNISQLNISKNLHNYIHLE